MFNNNTFGKSFIQMTGEDFRFFARLSMCCTTQKVTLHLTGNGIGMNQTEPVSPDIAYGLF